MAAARIHKPVAHVLLLLAALLGASVLPCTEGQRDCSKGCGFKGRCRSYGRVIGCDPREAGVDYEDRFALPEDESSLDFGEYFDVTPDEDISEETFPFGGLEPPYEDEMYLFLCTEQTYEEYYGEQGLPVPEVDPTNILLEELATDALVKVDAVLRNYLRSDVEVPEDFKVGDDVPGAPPDVINAARVITLPPGEDLNDVQVRQRAFESGLFASGAYGYGDAAGDGVEVCRTLYYTPDLPEGATRPTKQGSSDPTTNGSSESRTRDPRPPRPPRTRKERGERPPDPPRTRGERLPRRGRGD